MPSHGIITKWDYPPYSTASYYIVRLPFKSWCSVFLFSTAMPSSSLFKVTYSPKFNIDIKVWIATLTILKSSGWSCVTDHCSCVTETPACNPWGITTIGDTDTVAFSMPYTMRLFNTTIMVLEYNFPSTADVVTKYVALLIKKMRLMTAMAAVSNTSQKRNQNLA